MEARKSSAQDNNITSLALSLQGAKTNVQRYDIVHKMFLNYRTRGVLDSARLSSKELLVLGQAERNDSLLTTAYYSLAVYFSLAGDYPSTFEYNFKALNLAEKNGYKKQIGVVNSNIGWNYVLLGNYGEAIRFCKKGIAILSLVPNSEKSLVACYDNLAIAFLELKQVDSALTYTQLAYTLNLKAQNKLEQSYILYQFARIYLYLGDPQLAETYFRKSISYSLDNKISEPLIPTSTHLCKMLLEQNRIEEAKQVGIMGLKEAVVTGMQRQTIDNAEVLRDLYDKEKQIDSAYYYSRMANAIRDSIFNEQKNMQVRNLEFTQQLQENEMRAEHQKALIERKNNLQYAAIVVGLIAILIGFLVVSHSVVANPKLIKFLGVVSLLIVFEFLNLLLHPWLADLTHHSPLLMLLIMVCLGSLLVPLHHRLEHWVTNKLVEKNNRIRLAAAKKTIEQLEGRLTEET
jgi:tetratricopeptide (TPR) repeat protein